MASMSNVEILLNSIQVPGEAKVLTKSEEIVLGTLIQDPDTFDAARQKAINILVVKNIYLVLKLVHRYKRTSFDFEDLVGYGILGLFSAARKYDPNKSTRFASYARHWIKEATMKAIREYSGAPKIPVYLVKNLWNVTRLISKNEGISDEDLASCAKLEIATVQHLRSLMFKIIQFDPEYMDLNYDTPETQYIRKESAKILNDTLDNVLTPDERLVLNYSCELSGYPKMTFTRIETEFGIQKARQLKASAIDKLSKDKQLRTSYKDS